MKDFDLSARYWNITECTIPVGKITIIADYCKGGEDCDECIRFCPEKVLEQGKIPNEKGFFPPVLIDEAKCTVCGKCQLYCSENAIFVEKVGERVVAPDEIRIGEEKVQ